MKQKNSAAELSPRLVLKVQIAPPGSACDFPNLLLSSAIPGKLGRVDHPEK